MKLKNHISLWFWMVEAMAALLHAHCLWGGKCVVCFSSVFSIHWVQSGCYMKWRKGQWWRIGPSMFQVGQIEAPQNSSTCYSTMQGCEGLKGGSYYSISQSSSARCERHESDFLLSPPQMASCQCGPLNQVWHCFVALFPDIYKSLLSSTAQFCQQSEPLMNFFSMKLFTRL